MDIQYEGIAIQEDHPYFSKYQLTIRGIEYEVTLTKYPDYIRRWCATVRPTLNEGHMIGLCTRLHPKPPDDLFKGLIYPDNVSVVALFAGNKCLVVYKQKKAKVPTPLQEFFREVRNHFVGIRVHRSIHAILEGAIYGECNLDISRGSDLNQMAAGVNGDLLRADLPEISMHILGHHPFFPGPLEPMWNNRRMSMENLGSIAFESFLVYELARRIQNQVQPPPAGGEAIVTKRKRKNEFEME